MGEDILTQDLWDVAQAFCSLLAIFDKATTHFSYVYQPTINDVVVKIVEIIAELSSYTQSHPLLDCVLSMKSKLLKYFFDMPKLFLISAILDPRYKTRISNYLQYYYQKLDVPYDVSGIMNDSNNLLQFLYDKYSEDAQPATPQTPSQPMPSVPVSQFLYDTLVRGPGVSTTSGPEGRYAELNEYLHCSGYAQPDESSDILLWWKENRKKYPILHKIAKDILVCPPFTMAIESPFNTTRWIPDHKQASLTPSRIEVLICLKDWQMAYN